MRTYLCIPEDDNNHHWTETYETGTEPFISQVNCPDHDGFAAPEGPSQNKELSWPTTSR